jgi:hypothetical protein
MWRSCLLYEDGTLVSMQVFMAGSWFNPRRRPLPDRRPDAARAIDTTVVRARLQQMETQIGVAIAEISQRDADLARARAAAADAERRAGEAEARQQEATRRCSELEKRCAWR